MKTRPAGAELFHEVRRTDKCTYGRTDYRHGKANSRFSQFFERAYKTPPLLPFGPSSRDFLILRIKYSPLPHVINLFLRPSLNVTDLDSHPQKYV